MIKNLRRSLIGIIILVLLAVVFNYLHIWYRRDHSVEKVSQILGSETIRSFSRWESSENQNGIPKFKVSAQQLLETRQGKSYLEGIEAFDFNPDGSVHHEIRSLRAEYDRDRKLADFTGNVRLFLGGGIELRTNSLHYDFNSKVGVTEEKIQIVSQVASGSARGVRFNQKQGSLDLKSDAEFVFVSGKPRAGDSAEPEKFHAVSDRAYCTDQLRHIVFLGKARLDSKGASLSGESIETVLGAERKQITSLTATGNAVYQSGDPGDRRTLQGDRMIFGIGDAQAIEQVRVAGKAMFSSVSSGDEESLQGEEIDLKFDAASGLPSRIQSKGDVAFSRKRGEEQLQVSGDMLTAAFVPGTKYLENIHVQKQAFLHAANNSSAIGNELHADDIRMGFRQAGERAALEKLHAEGSARWSSEPSQQPASKSREPGRILSASSLDMLYSSEGDSFESGSASGKVMISESRSPIKDQSKARRLLADRVQFYFFPGKNRLREMNASGHVQVIQENRAVNKASSTVDSFRTSSDNMKVVFLPEQNDSSIQSLAQWGSFKYQDASTSATAGRCDYDAQKETLVLKDSPQISNETNSTTGEWMEYEQKTGVLSVRGRVRSLLSSGKNEASFFTASSSSSPAIVTANEMQYWTADRRAQYTGSVQLLSENGQLQAGILNITDGGERVTAQNGIRHYMIPGRSASETQARTDKAEDAPKPESKAVEIRCSSLKYLKARNTITYEGNVTAHSGDIDLSSESLEAMIADEGGAVEHAIAYGKVTIRQGGRECKGDKADYFLDRRAFILTGNPAEILDPVKGRSFASQLTYFIADDRILLENR